MSERDPIYVTQPYLPPIEEILPAFENIWRTRWLTNSGEYHQKLERKLCEFLGVGHINLFCNGTIALETALRAYSIKGEVITSAFTFIATANAISNVGAKPVFCDISPDTLNLDPKKVEQLITEKTTAIVPVHVYGTVCDVEAYESIGRRHGIKIIYDAAHAFDVSIEGKSVLGYGDASMLSFHATKCFHTVEGGALVVPGRELKEKVDRMKNFGFIGETSVDGTGGNGKLNELQSVIGLAQLGRFEEIREARKKVAHQYRDLLSEIEGLQLLGQQKGVRPNYSYFPILIGEGETNNQRDRVYNELKKENIYARRYFYPLITDMGSVEYSRDQSELPVSAMAANRVLCLPIYPGLTESEIFDISAIVKASL